MNRIEMIPVTQLLHHPDNPRLDLGDLTELAESIKANGVMQNLTVVQVDDGVYNVVIGNRRMEAAKLAGLTEVPCVVSEMDYKTQVATMLMENMQRQDLTLYEQAQGFQMMMDLGFSAKEIAEKTGFGETTIRRRLKMAELNKDTLKDVLEGKYNDVQQIRMGDFDLLAQVEDVEERNRLLRDIGGRDFDWSIKRTLNLQKANKVLPQAKEILKKAKIKKLPNGKEYSSEYDRQYSMTVKLHMWTPGEQLIPDPPAGADELFYKIDEEEIYFWTKAKKPERAKPVEKSKAEREREKQIDNAWKIADRITEMSAEKRASFVEGLTVGPKNAMQMLRWALIASMSDLMNHNYNTYTGLKKNFELEGTYTWDYVDAIQKKIMAMKQSEWPKLILIIFEGLPEKKNDYQSFTSGYRKEWPAHQRNPRIEQCYAWLTEFGYQMNDEEIQMMAGTHEIFKKGGKNHG